MARGPQFIFMAVGGDTTYPTPEHEIQLGLNKGALGNRRGSSHDVKRVSVLCFQVSRFFYGHVLARTLRK
jgi:hypothetical protein